MMKHTETDLTAWSLYQLLDGYAEHCEAERGLRSFRDNPSIAARMNVHAGWMDAIEREIERRIAR